ncbi:MAG: XRE family transcriptional regulator [Lachnospiraceae bacterium]|nr:XRE family transcriptional regulator [Lachnospiraceae bacterium]
MKKTTEELLKTLQKTAEIDSFLLEEDENFKTLPLHLYLDKVFAKSEITRSQCIRNSGLDRTYCYQIFSGQKLPSRDKVLALCFGLALGFEKTQLLLKSTGYPPLYPRNKRDSILIFALQRKHSILETNELLQDLGYELVC